LNTEKPTPNTTRKSSLSKSTKSERQNKSLKKSLVGKTPEKESTPRNSKRNIIVEEDVKEETEERFSSSTSSKRSATDGEQETFDSLRPGLRKVNKSKFLSSILDQRPTSTSPTPTPSRRKSYTKKSASKSLSSVAEQTDSTRKSGNFNFKQPDFPINLQKEEKFDEESVITPRKSGRKSKSESKSLSETPKSTKQSGRKAQSANIPPKSVTQVQPIFSGSPALNLPPPLHLSGNTASYAFPLITNSSPSIFQQSPGKGFSSIPSPTISSSITSTPKSATTSGRRKSKTLRSEDVLFPTAKKTPNSVSKSSLTSAAAASPQSAISVTLTSNDDDEKELFGGDIIETSTTRTPRSSSSRQSKKSASGSGRGRGGFKSPSTSSGRKSGGIHPSPPVSSYQNAADYFSMNQSDQTNPRVGVPAPVIQSGVGSPGGLKTQSSFLPPPFASSPGYNPTGNSTQTGISNVGPNPHFMSSIKTNQQYKYSPQNIQISQK
jgi:hypothetical protein